MAWVPLVGSALGSLIGGLLSDFFIRTFLTASRFRSRSGESDADGDEGAGNVMGDDAGRLSLSLSLSQSYECMYVRSNVIFSAYVDDHEQKVEVKSSLIDSGNFLRDTKGRASRSSQLHNTSSG